jgi:uncharacterized protein (TIGR03067 family)
MKQRFPIIVITALLIAALGHTRGQSEKQQDSKSFADLNGTWTIQKMEANGRSLLKAGEKWSITIRDGKVSSNEPMAPKEAMDIAKLLDPAKKPKTITYAYEGNITFFGIYEVKGDELFVCGDGVDTATQKDPEARRPKKFDSNDGLLFVFKREKKKANTGKPADKIDPKDRRSQQLDWANKDNARHSWVNVTKDKEKGVGVSVQFSVVEKVALAVTMKIPPGQAKLQNLAVAVALLSQDDQPSHVRPVFSAPIELRATEDGTLVGHLSIKKDLLPNLTIELRCGEIGGPQQIYQFNVNSYLAR